MRSGSTREKGDTKCPIHRGFQPFAIVLINYLPSDTLTQALRLMSSHHAYLAVGAVVISLIVGSCDSRTRSAVRAAATPTLPSATIDSLYVKSDSSFVVAATLNGRSESVVLSTRLLQAIVIQQKHLRESVDRIRRPELSDESHQRVVDPYRTTSSYDDAEYVVSHTHAWITIAGVGDSIVAATIPSDVVGGVARIHTQVYAEPSGLSVGYNEAGRLRFTVDESMRVTSIVGLGLVALTLVSIGLLLQALRVRRTSARFRRRILATREAERRRIASDLHDGPVQQLHHLMFQCDRARNDGGMFSAFRDDLQIVSRELRDICSELRPPMLTNFGLSQALRSLIAEWSNRFPGVTVHADIDPDLARAADEAAQLTVYRTVQESLNNVIKHSQATEVEVRAHRRGTTLETSVRDNGIGFAARTDWSRLEEDGHLGLSLAAQRAQSVGGRLSIRSAIGRGTTVTLVVPCRQRTRRIAPSRAAAAQLAEST